MGCGWQPPARNSRLHRHSFSDQQLAAAAAAAATAAAAAATVAKEKMELWPRLPFENTVRAHATGSALQLLAEYEQTVGRLVRVYVKDGRLQTHLEEGSSLAQEENIQRSRLPGFYGYVVDFSLIGC
jgi:hypothetical protein